MALDKEDIKQLIAILQKGLVDGEDSSVNSTPKNKKNPNNIKTKKSRAIQNTEDSENKFISMGFYNLHKEDIAIDMALRKNPPTTRNRKAKFVEVTCRSCGKKEKISDSLLYESSDRYKCNKCCSSPG